mmetsp:Transcript_9326/g.13584  ORF Transcript_9326/g.13584 Transcript_9326/m.13584 type:complete len:281 (-) Transcript_9326:268-1110(-)|eukprot:CAMPEP_0195521540 /NCGR_PEP_ID=MMETSP0794_2-20130614/18916_1 /TAXON_ID=515487 /ORGANISM="Stephanopyxis turris, Strain CCMP 815" /LENGTH=280 /DNA_ID=CAMNT_0040651115 /DNA_START=109 /DNA_END=951 /DNA_ORIENTATION=-
MTTTSSLRIGVLALQGAFEEHQTCLESTGCTTLQVRTPADLNNIDAIVFPGGESTAMGLIGTQDGMWDALKSFIKTGKPTWGTCAGMILLAERCVAASAVIENGQSLIGGLDVLVCRNYFGSQISSCQMAVPPPPGMTEGGDSFPGVFIRAPAILTAGKGVEVLGKVVAIPCRHAAATLKEMDKKIASGEDILMMGVVDALHADEKLPQINEAEEKKETIGDGNIISLPGAAEGTDAREVICAVRKENLLCTAFHPELTRDRRWHEYFVGMVKESTQQEN